MAILFEGYSQASTRSYRRFRDQHGRPWGTNVEHKSNAPCGHWTPPVAPIVPDAQYLVLSKDPDNPNVVTIDYDRIIADLRADLVAYNKEAQRLMSQRHGDKYRPDMPLDSDIGQVVGDRPAPVEPWIAAKQGNPYILGFTNKIDMRLVPFLNLKGSEDDEPDFGPEPDFTEELEDQIDPQATGGTRVPVRAQKPQNEWTEFLRARKAEGKTMQQASAEWRLLKADAA